jgi:hypothetical protein
MHQQDYKGQESLEGRREGGRKGGGGEGGREGGSIGSNDLIRARHPNCSCVQWAILASDN